jgi:AraC family transcriptional regulator
MQRQSTQVEYGQRLKRVLTYVEEHLNEDLSLNKLAQLACLSPYHFHRIYRSMLGETVAETVRRLRLHQAGADLASTDTPTTKVAKQAGFSTVEGFSRAFADDYGLPPGAFRDRQSTGRQGDPPIDRAAVSEFDGVCLAGLEHRGAYTLIGHEFAQLSAWAASRSLLDKPRRWFGVFYSDPDVVPEADLRSIAGVEVSSDDTDAAVLVSHLPRCRVVSLTHKGPYAEVYRAYEYLYRDWLPASGEEPDDQPCFEQYLNNPRDTPTAELLTKVFLPLKSPAERARSM